jgi:hypothetical protein
MSRVSSALMLGGFATSHGMTTHAGKEAAIVGLHVISLNHAAEITYAFTPGRARTLANQLLTQADRADAHERGEHKVGELEALAVILWEDEP